MNNSYVANPNPDAIEEFRVLESNYSAEYGRNAGGIVSVVTKSGTNSLHGTAYDYVRNTDLNANDFFSNELGQPRNDLKRNQFGGTIGGPIYIPKVVDGRNKLFFFFAYQGQRQNSVAQYGNVPAYTPAQLTGDFSHAVNGGPDPTVVGFLSSHRHFQPNSTLAAQGIISPASIDLARRGLADPDPIVRIGALDMLDGLPTDRIWPLVSPLLSDSSRGVRIRAVSVLAAAPTANQPAADRAAFERAAAEFVAAQEFNADRPESR